MSDKIRILVVDHDPDVLLATSRLLKEAGYEVLEASTGKECLGVVRRSRPDLVLLEVVLPDMDGTEACKRIKADPSLRGPYSGSLVRRQDLVRIAGGRPGGRG